MLCDAGFSVNAVQRKLFLCETRIARYAAGIPAVRRAGRGRAFPACRLIGGAAAVTIGWGGGSMIPGNRGWSKWKVVAALGLAAVSPRPGSSASIPARAPLQSGLHRENAVYGVDFWREAEGFAQSRVRAIVQTRDGYMWLGTDGGLVRFNGESFTAFTIRTGALKDNEVWALQEDDAGGLWIGTYGGGLTFLKDGRFRTFTTADGLPDDVVTSLAKDRQGNIWVITPRGMTRSSHGVFTRVTPADGLPEARVLAVCGSASQGVVAAARNAVYRSLGGRFESLPPAGDLGVPGRLACASDGSVWVGYSSGAIEQRKDGVSRVFAPPPDAPGPVSYLYEDPQGGVWAVLGRRIAKLRNGAFETVSMEGGAANLGPVYTLCMDREGGVWLGLRSNGLARLRTRRISTLLVEDGLPDDRTLSVFEDGSGDIWVGTGDGLARYRDGRFATWTAANGSRLGRPVYRRRLERHSVDLG